MDAHRNALEAGHFGGGVGRCLLEKEEIGAGARKRWPDKRGGGLPGQSVDCLSRISEQVRSSFLVVWLGSATCWGAGSLLEQRDLGWTCRRMFVDLLCTGPPTGDHQAGRQGRQACKATVL